MADVLLWLATYLVHSTVLLGLAALADRAGLLRDRALAETVWRVALLGALATASAAPVLSLLDDLQSKLRETPTGRAETAWQATVPGTIPTPARAPAATRPALEPAPVAAETLLPAVERPTIALPSNVRATAPTVVGVWTALVAAMLAVLLLQLAHIRRVARGAHAADEALSATVAKLARRAGIRAPAVRVTTRWASPLVTPDRRLFVPAWALADLTDQQREAMLAHEIAHLRRRDPWWRLLGETIARVFVMQPLNRIAVRRLDELAELECDAWAAAATGRGRDLAECLVACAERVHARGAPALALAMARPSSPLIERVSTLLEDVPMRDTPNWSRLNRAIARALAITVGVGALAALPIVTIEAVAKADAGERHSVSINSSPFGKSMAMDVETKAGRLRAAIDGEIEFNDAETDVATLDDEAWIETEFDGVERRIEFESDGGTIVRKYFVDDEERPLDTEGRAWLAQAIPMIMRETGWKAEERVARIRAKGGAAAVLTEIGEVRGNYARRVYVEALAGSGTLTAAEQDRTIALVGEMTSDYERRESYGALVENQTIEAPQQVGVLRGVAAMASDYEQRTVLESLAPKLEATPDVVAAWSAAVGTIESDFEARTAITTLEENARSVTAFVPAALAAAAELGSDFEHRTALESLVEHVGPSPELLRAYAQSAGGIGSDYERRVALVALIAHAPLDVAAALAILDAAAGMGSDYETRQVLVELAAKMPSDQALIRRYRQVARELGDYERGQAEKALDHFEV